MKILKDIQEGEYQTTIKSLEEFIRQALQNEHSTLEQSKKNIKKGLLRIIKKGRYSSNGLLITKDGYLLMAKHSIFNIDETTRIKDMEGCSYELEGICAVSEDEDIALAKAKIEKNSEHMNYKFYNTDKLEIEMPVSLLSYNKKDEFKEIDKGFVEQLNNPFLVKSYEEKILWNNQFVSNIQSGPRHSGGIIISEKGNIVGILSGGSIDYPLTFGVKSLKALELINFYREKLIEKNRIKS